MVIYKEENLMINTERLFYIAGKQKNINSGKKKIKQTKKTPTGISSRADILPLTTKMQ